MLILFVDLLDEFGGGLLSGVLAGVFAAVSNGMLDTENAAADGILADEVKIEGAYECVFVMTGGLLNGVFAGVFAGTSNGISEMEGVRGGVTDIVGVAFLVRKYSGEDERVMGGVIEISGASIAW